MDKMPRVACCPKCNSEGPRHSQGFRFVRSGVLNQLQRINWAKYWCESCGHYFTHSSPAHLLYNPRGRGHQYDHQTVLVCLLRMDEGWTYKAIQKAYGVPPSTMLGWWKKSKQDQDSRSITVYDGFKVKHPTKFAVITTEAGGRKRAGGSQPPDPLPPPVNPH